MKLRNNGKAEKSKAERKGIYVKDLEVGIENA